MEYSPFIRDPIYYVFGVSHVTTISPNQCLCVDALSHMVKGQDLLTRFTLKIMKEMVDVICANKIINMNNITYGDLFMDILMEKLDTTPKSIFDFIGKYHFYRLGGIRKSQYITIVTDDQLLRDLYAIRHDKDEKKEILFDMYAYLKTVTLNRLL